MTTIRVRVTDPDILYSYSQPQSWYANEFKIGDMEVDSLNKPLSKIINIEKFSTDSTHKAVYLDIEVRSLYDSRSKQYSFKGKPLIFGSSLRFNLKHVYFDSVVVRPPNDTIDNSRIRIRAKAELKDIATYYAEAIKKFEGQSIFDNAGNIYLTIDKVNISTSKNVYKFINLDNTDLTLKKSEEYRDAFLDITMNVKHIQNELFAYEDIPVKIGETIPIGFPEFVFNPLIIDITSQFTN